jgi:hypothetical protein
MVDKELVDTTLGDLQDGTRSDDVTTEREHIVDDGALTERPRLDDPTPGLTKLTAIIAPKLPTKRITYPVATKRVVVVCPASCTLPNPTGAAPLLWVLASRSCPFDGTLPSRW